MKSKVFLFNALMLCLLKVGAQQQYVKLPDVIPPSPSSFAMTRYGGVSLGLQTGTIQQSIPLYNLTCRKLSLPISLSYSSNGIKVDEIASRTGMTWVLNAGGVVTRTVYGQPDGQSTMLYPPASLNPSQELYTFLDAATRDYGQYGYDTYPDIFSFNFGGYSGQFIINGNTIVQLVKTNLKIESTLAGASGLNTTFRITTPDGVVYQFGAPESSYSSSLGENCDKRPSTPVPNAWYLTKIIHPDGEYIKFEYYQLTDYSYLASNFQSKTRSITPLPPSCPTGGTPIYIPDANCQSLLSTRPICPSKITTSTNNSIVFSYRSRKDLPYDSLVQSINIYESGNPVSIKSFDFQYADVISGGNTTNPLNVRPFLTSLSEHASSSDEKHTYSFEYYDMSAFPARLSYAQDHYGYFNGANNSTLIPTPSSSVYAQYFYDATANREASFSYALGGMLKKITYPTGGYDAISYSAPTYTYNDLPDPVQMTETASSIGARYFGDVTTIDTFTVPNTIIPIDGVLTSSFVYLGNPAEGDYHSRAQIVLIDASSGSTVVSQIVDFDNVGPYNVHFTLIGGKKYYLKCTSYGEFSNGYALVKYNYQDLTPVVKTKASGGVLVGKVETFDPATNKSIYKTYEYSSGSVTSPPVYIGDYFVNVSCGNQFDCGTVFQFKTMSSSSMTNLYTYSQHHIYYGRVVENHGLNAENGKIEHNYIVFGDVQSDPVMGNDILTSPYSNFGVGKNGLETLTNTYANVNSSFKLLSQVRRTYKDDSRLSEVFYGYTVRKRFAPLCTYSPTNSNSFDPFDLNRTHICSRWIYPDTIQTTSFDPSGRSTIQTEVTQYGNPVHLMPTQKTYNNSNGNTRINQFTYPSDLVTSTPYNYLHNKHVWEPVIERSELSYNPTNNTTTFLQSVKTGYQAWNGDTSQVFPVTVSSKQNNYDYEPRIQFLGYDSKGNVQSVSKAKDLNISYIYSYGGAFPIAQISNSDYSTIVEVLGGDAAVKAFRDNVNPTGTAVNTFLAPLRTNPNLKNALIKTYTYSPLIGMTSETDPKGYTTYYEYDSFGRLADAKDKDGNVIKKYNYHYQGQ